MKLFTVKIYSSDGSTFLKTYESSNIKSDIVFTSKINGGLGQLVLDLNIPFDEKDSAIDFMNIVKVYVSNESNPSGKLVYTGYISRYEAYFRAGNEGVKVTVLGLVSLLSYAYYKDGSNFTVTHTSEDPSDIFKAIIDHFQSVYSSVINYSPTSIETVGALVSYEFTKKKWNQAIVNTFELTGGDFYWYLDESGQFNLTSKSSSADHVFTMELDVEEFSTLADSESVENAIVVQYSGGGTRSTSDATSISTYGYREIYITDASLPDSDSADERKAFELSENKDLKNKAQLIINDNYDIESIKVGQTCKIRNIKIGANVFSDNMQISAITYQIDRVVLTLEEYTNFGNTLLTLINND